MFIEKFLCERLVSFADFFGMTLLACLPQARSRPPIVSFRFLLSLPTSFLRVCLPTFFAAVYRLQPLQFWRS